MADTSPETQGPTPKKSQPPHWGKSGLALWKRWGLALTLTLIFAVGNWQLESTSVGRWLQFEAFSGLHALLPPFGSEPLPVVVVNIHDLPSYQGHATSRTDLQSLIDEIADQKPAAIGVDIDFSPEEYKPQTPEDQEFFDFCHDLTLGKRDDGRRLDGVPIFLGVHRALFQPPEYWLGYPDDNGMAAALSMPQRDSRRLPRWYAGPPYGDEVYLPSLAEALAEAYVAGPGKALPGPRRLARLVETIPSAPSGEHPSEVGGVEEEIKSPAPAGFRDGLSPVNYSKLEELKRETLPVNMRNGKAVITGDFQGRIILLGDTDATDVFTDPGPLQPFRGVYLHACAAYTFTQQPLYEFRPPVRFWLDVILSIVLIAALYGLEVLDEVGQRRRQGRHLGILGLTLFLGWLLLCWAGILWLDFIAILIALALHPSAEMHSHPLWDKAEKHLHQYRETRRANRRKAPETAPEAPPPTE